jgi:hypothetical protein
MIGIARKRRLFSALGLLIFDWLQIFKVTDDDERIVELLRCDQLHQIQVPLLRWLLNRADTAGRSFSRLRLYIGARTKILILSSRPAAQPHKSFSRTIMRCALKVRQLGMGVSGCEQQLRTTSYFEPTTPCYLLWLPRASVSSSNAPRWIIRERSTRGERQYSAIPNLAGAGARLLCNIGPTYTVLEHHGV